ncbi:MAG: exodeoxyribonuclease III [Candidatus Nomurabacteria bacterium]
MKIITWNVNGIRAIEKKGELDNIIKNYSPDILCLQETKSEIEQLHNDLKNKEGYYSFFESSKMRKGYSGVAIYTKVNPIKVSGTMGYEESDFLDNEGRTIIAEYEDFYLLNIYFPNGGKSEEHFLYKLEYYKRLLKLVLKLEKKKSVIFCGDVNATVADIDLARPKENAGHVGLTPEERELLADFKKYFLDIWREENPDKEEYTWWDMKTRARDRNIGWRIDYFFISKKLKLKVKKIKILGDQFGSDHAPVFLEI